MLRPRIIPCLLIHDKGLIKSIKFNNYKYIGDKKLDQWTKETDFSFIVIDSDSLIKGFVLKEKCFVGLNPCFEYIGPKPR